MRRLRGLKDLVVDGVQEVSGLVQRAERAAGDRVVRWMKPVAPLDEVARGVVGVREVASASTHLAIRGIAQGVRHAGELGIAIAARGQDRAVERPAPRWVDIAEGAVNGVIGDHLARRGNGLDVGMSLRDEGRVVELTREAMGERWGGSDGRLCVFVHGLSATEWAWSISSEAFHGAPEVTFGVLLERELGWTPLYVRYNSGRHVSDSGQELAALLRRALTHWPTPVRELVLVGHSMGGLVARSAVAHAAEAGADHAVWLDPLTDVFTLGSPHHGAPLEKFAHVAGRVLDRIDLTWTKVSAEVLSARSDGIKDLRLGYTMPEAGGEANGDGVLDDLRLGYPHVDGVRYLALGTTLTRDPSHPLGVLIGDWMVRVPSSTGQGSEPGRRIPFHSTQVIPGMSHNDLANHPDVYATIVRWLSEREATPSDEAAARDAPGS